jgi:membrane-bound lytic murein transglycosylase D
MNIASATRGAARYIKKNNYQFNNWVYALQAYQMGAGGVSRSVPDVESGTKHMTITSQTYWYVKKYLAHKIAFEGALQNKTNETLLLTNVTNIDLKSLAEKTGLEETKLRALNLWIRKNAVPDDKLYALVVPLNEGSKIENFENPVSKNTTQNTRTKSNNNIMQYLHGLPVVYAQSNETISMLAQKNGLSLPAFMRHNDLHGYEKIMPNIPYYLKAKHKKSTNTTTVVKAGQDLWQISQQEGVKLSALQKFNRKKNNELQQGEIIWLASRKPKTEKQILPQNYQTPELDNAMFNWEILLPTDTAITNPKEVNNTPEVKPGWLTAGTTTVLEVPTDGQHEVKPGETLSAIGRLYAIPVEKLITLNSLAGTTIQPGQKIKLTEQLPAKQLNKKSVWHEVKAGETLYSIARQYSVTIKEICDWNNKKDFDVKPGEKLKVELVK